MEAKVPDSGSVKITVPSNLPGSTSVQVEPGTHEHKVLIREGEPMAEDGDPQVERRRSAAPVNLQVSNTPGLPGRWGIFANLTAFAFVLFFCYTLWSAIKETINDNKALLKEELKALKDEMRAARDSDDKRDLAFLTAMSAMQTKVDGMALAFMTAHAEAKSSRQAMEAKLDKILDFFVKSKTFEEVFVPAVAPRPREKQYGFQEVLGDRTRPMVAPVGNPRSDKP